MHRLAVHHITLRRFNDGLTVILIGLGTYLLVLPIMPQASWWFKHSAPIISSPASSTLPTALPQPVSNENLLLIPRLDLKKTIHEGTAVNTVDKGAWHRPGTGTPLNGNMVIAGHRFNYKGQTMFYHLEKVQKGDEIGVYWQGSFYRYRVYEIKEVGPDDLSIEAPTEERRLTIYTCTPLWSAKNRLVVLAEPVSNRAEAP